LLVSEANHRNAAAFPNSAINSGSTDDQIFEKRIDLFR